MSDSDEATSPYLSQDTSWLEGLPGGHLVTTQLDHVPHFHYLLVGLGSEQESYNVATLRMHRVGGSNAADVVLRQNVFTLVGAMAVAGGHIEAEMKRIIIQAEEDRGATFIDVDETWTGLERRLEAIAAGDGPLASPVAEALAWGREHRIKGIRDDAVHATWCLYDVGSIQRSRFRRRSDDEVHLGRLEDYLGLVPKMFEYANRLGHIGSWPTALLPPLPDLEPGEVLVIKVDTDVTHDA